MNLVPKPVSRLANRGVLKLSKASPTLLVVGGVIGLGASAVLAAKATRKLDPILEEHNNARDLLEQATYSSDRARQQSLVGVYKTTGWELLKIYGPAIFIGGSSAVAILGGHKILMGRHLATMAAYSGLLEQFTDYRGRIARTLGEAAENDIYNGAHGEYQEDPDHKGEYKLGPVFDSEGRKVDFKSPWYTEGVPGWTEHAESNQMKLRGIQSHMNHILDARGHLFLNEVYDALHIPHTREGSVTGWLSDPRKGGDGFVDFGFDLSNDPNTIAFRAGHTPDVQLNFNIDGVIWDRI